MLTPTPKCYDCKNYLDYHRSDYPLCSVYTVVPVKIFEAVENCEYFEQKPDKFTQICQVCEKEIETEYNDPQVCPDCVSNLKCSDCPDSDIVFDWYLKDEKSLKSAEWIIECVDCSEAVTGKTAKIAYNKWIKKNDNSNT